MTQLNDGRSLILYSSESTSFRTAGSSATPRMDRIVIVKIVLAIAFGYATEGPGADAVTGLRRGAGGAEREGFEPSRPLRAYGISSAAPSTELGDRSA